MKGSGNHYDLGARMYDPRTGRMRSRDPREGEYAWQSTYAYYANSPIKQIDYNGEGGFKYPVSFNAPNFAFMEGMRQYADAFFSTFSFDFEAGRKKTIIEKMGAYSIITETKKFFGFGTDFSTLMDMNGSNTWFAPLKPMIYTKSGTEQSTTSSVSTPVVIYGLPGEVSVSHTEKSDGTSENSLEVSAGIVSKGIFDVKAYTKSTNSTSSTGEKSNKVDVGVAAELSYWIKTTETETKTIIEKSSLFFDAKVTATTK